jgi:16S rRNA G966 N2-methylase RsmD
MSLQNEYLLLNKDEEGLWSLTQQKDADKISQIIINMVGSDKKIIDGTAGLGGNTISFCKYFKEVVGIEKDTSRYNLLALNLSSYQFNNLKLYNNSCLEFLDNEYDVIFFDPPWGGYQYKKHKELNLFLDNYS